MDSIRGVLRWPGIVLPQVMVHANNDEMLTVSCWKTWVECHVAPIVARLRESRVFKEIYLAVGNESLAPWHVERFGARLFPCLQEVGCLVGWLVVVSSYWSSGGPGRTDKNQA